MTFTELVNDVASRLNLTSPEALTRIGVRINDRYRRVTSSIGLITSRRVTQDVVVDPTDPSSVLPDLVITGMEKVLRINTTDNAGRIRTLEQLSYDDITNIPTLSRLPQAWAMKLMGSNTVTITLDSFFPTTTFTLHLEGYDIADTLSGSAIPAFPMDFHDILVNGAMADEQMKMEKPQLAQISEMKYEARLSDLRMFIAKSSYMDIMQGKNKPDQLYYVPWSGRIGVV